MKNEKEKKRLLCVICQKTYLPVDGLKANKEYTYYFCPTCGLGVLWPRLTSSKIKSIYESKKYFEDLSAPVTNPFMQWILTKGIYEKPSVWVKKTFKPGKILDIGCGDGKIMEIIGDKSWDITNNKELYKNLLFVQEVF